MKKMKLLCILSSLIGSLVVLFSITSCGSSTNANAAPPVWKFAYMSDHKLDQATDQLYESTRRATDGRRYVDTEGQDGCHRG